MSPAQIEKLREAFRELYRLNKWPEDRRSYNNIALIHQNHCQALADIDCKGRAR